MTTGLVHKLSDPLQSPDRDLLVRVEQFLYLEARLMDENRYDEWLALWREDEVQYWAPLCDDNSDPRQHLSLIYADRALLEERVFRLGHTPAHAQSPPSRMHRVVSNVMVEEHDPEPGTVHATSVFMIFEVRRGLGTLYSGRSVHVMDIHPSGFRIKSKKVMLTLNDEPLGNLTFLL